MSVMVLVLVNNDNPEKLIRITYNKPSKEGFLSLESPEQPAVLVMRRDSEPEEGLF